MKTIGVLISFLALLLIAASISSATVIDFDSEDWFGTGHKVVSKQFSDDGAFVVGPQTIATFKVWGNQDVNYAGSAAITNGRSGDYSILRRWDFGTFDFNSIDLSENYAPEYVATRPWDYPDEINVLFKGTFLDGSIVSTTATLDMAFGFQTFNFGNLFTDVVSVRWYQGTELGAYHQFDNIAVNEAIPTPEPSTMVLLSSGLAGLAWYGRKRKKA